MGKRKSGEQRKQATDFKEAACCPSAVVKGQHGEKMGGSTQGNLGSREGQQPFRLKPNGFGNSTTTLRGLLIGAA